MKVCCVLLTPYFIYFFRITREPKTLKDLQESLALYDKLVAEIPEKEKEFPIIRDQMAVLSESHFLTAVFQPQLIY